MKNKNVEILPIP